MIATRVIPCLLLKSGGLVKTQRFKDPQYLGDPINIVRIFNDKEVDELVFLDITATVDRKKPPFDLLGKIATECFMPLAYGGGIHDLEDMKRLFNLGIEKIVINSYAAENPDFIDAATKEFATSSVVVSIDVKKNWLRRYEVVTCAGRKKTGLEPVKFALEMERRGAGELLLNSIDRDGTMEGYDLDLVSRVASVVSIPVVACGGAGNIQDLRSVVRKAGASAAAAGSMFVFHGPHRAVLISYPSASDLRTMFEETPKVHHDVSI